MLTIRGGPPAVGMSTTGNLLQVLSHELGIGRMSLAPVKTQSWIQGGTLVSYILLISILGTCPRSRSVCEPSLHYTFKDVLKNFTYNVKFLLKCLCHHTIVNHLSLKTSRKE